MTNTTYITYLFVTLVLANFTMEVSPTRYLILTVTTNEELIVEILSPFIVVLFKLYIVLDVNGLTK